MLKDLPDVPTFKELGIALVEPSTWFGIYAPKGTPKAIIAKIHDDLDAILHSPETHDKLIALGYTVDSGSPEKLAAFMAEDTAKWAKVAKTMTFGSP